MMDTVARLAWAWVWLSLRVPAAFHGGGERLLFLYVMELLEDQKLRFNSRSGPSKGCVYVER